MASQLFSSRVGTITKQEMQVDAYLPGRFPSRHNVNTQWNLQSSRIARQDVPEFSEIRSIVLADPGWSA